MIIQLGANNQNNERVSGRYEKVSGISLNVEKTSKTKPSPLSSNEKKLQKLWYSKAAPFGSTSLLPSKIGRPVEIL